MSDDIVERLRNRAETLGWLNEQNGTREMLLTAADEIERLRAEVSRLRNAGDTLIEALDHGTWVIDTMPAVIAWQEARREQ